MCDRQKKKRRNLRITHLHLIIFNSSSLLIFVWYFDLSYDKIKLKYVLDRIDKRRYSCDKDESELIWASYVNGFIFLDSHSVLDSLSFIRKRDDERKERLRG